MVEVGRQIGAAGVLHRRGGRAAVAAVAGVGWSRSMSSLVTTPPASAPRGSSSDGRRGRL